MTAAIAAAWELLKRLPWKTIGEILAGIALGLLIWRAPWAASRQKAADYAKFQPKLDRALKLELAAIGSIGRLRASIDQQNASIREQAKAETAKLAGAQAILAAARRHDAATDAQIARLRASAAQPRSGAPCDASDATKELWK